MVTKEMPGVCLAAQCQEEANEWCNRVCLDYVACVSDIDGHFGQQRRRRQLRALGLVQQLCLGKGCHFSHLNRRTFVTFGTDDARLLENYLQTQKHGN